MKKLSFIFVFSIVFLGISPFFSLAADSPAPIIDSDLQEPVPAFYLDGNFDYYTAYYVTYKQGRNPEYILYEVNCHVNHGETVAFTLGAYNYSFGSLSSSIVCDLINEYNAVTGVLLTTRTNISINHDGNANSSQPGYYWFNVTSANNGRTYTDSFLISNNINIVGTNYKWLSTDSFINWFVPHNNDVLRSTIPQPLSDLRHMYFADHLYLYQLNIDYPILYSSVGLTANNLTSSEFFDQCFIQLQKASSDTINIKIVNNSEYSFTVYLSIYDIISGEFVSTTSFPISPIQSSGNPFIATFGQRLNDPVTYGIWYTGFVNTDGLSNFDKLQISWSDTIDYSQDFILIRNLLDQIYNSLDYIENKLDGLFTLISDNWTWFKTLYFNTILQKWTITENQLNQIIQALVGTGQETTYPPDENASSEMNNYVSQEDQFFQDFDSAGQDIDNVFDEAVSAFQDNSNGFAFIKMLMETFIFSIPSSYIIVFISLSFGLVVLFLGRAVKKR